MTVYYVDDGGSNTSPYDTWAKAAPDIKTLDAAVALASGDIVYFGHDSVDTTSTSLTIVGPTADAPVRFISATQGSDPPTYQAGTAAQIKSTAAASLTFDGSFSLVGMSVAHAYDIFSVGAVFSCDQNEFTYIEDCTVTVAATSFIQLGGSNGWSVVNGAVIDLTADGSTPRAYSVFRNTTGTVEVRGLSFINPGYRTSAIFMFSPSYLAILTVSGCDFSGFTNATLCELMSFSGSVCVTANFSHCKTAETWSAFADRPTSTGTRATLINCGPAHAPTSLIERVYQADLISTTSIYRTGGAEIEGIATAWLITTESNNSEAAPYYLPWMYGTVDAGSQTFTVHITNDAADMTDEEVWLEVQYLGTSGSSMGTEVSDHRASPTATVTSQTDDTSSTWNGTGPSFTYKQKLSVTATVGEAGQYRARVVVGKASIASSAYFYIDPAVTVI